MFPETRIINSKTLFGIMQNYFPKRIISGFLDTTAQIFFKANLLNGLFPFDHFE